MSSNFPLISIVMPVYNGEQFMRETIDSVLNQTYQHFEFIIINDGSTDHTQQILESYHDTRIKPTLLKKNAGVSNARNVGINLAKGEYIAFCDSDDVYDTNRLKAQFEFLQNKPSIDLCGSSIIFFEHGVERLIPCPESDKEIKEFFLRGNAIAQPTVMGKSSIFKKHKYNTQLQASEDYDLWTRMAIAGITFGNLPQPLVKYRAHEAQASKTKGKLLDQTFKSTCTNYSLIYLDSSKLTNYASTQEITLADFLNFVDELSTCAQGKYKNINLFLPLIALQYKKLNRHNLKSYISTKLLYKKFKIYFPKKYLRNIFLLNLFSIRRKYSLFDTLTKLKI
jgi:glycosyltransferase involved in cell wall biosynthesis